MKFKMRDKKGNIYIAEETSKKIRPLDSKQAVKDADEEPAFTESEIKAIKELIDLLPKLSALVDNDKEDDQDEPEADDQDETEAEAEGEADTDFLDESDEVIDSENLDDNDDEIIEDEALDDLAITDSKKSFGSVESKQIVDNDTANEDISAVWAKYYNN